MTRLARLLAAYAPHDGSFELAVPGLHASRFSRANTECFHAIRVPSLCIVAQGAKTTVVGQGYLSASQFSREYSRFFGSAPTRDIAKLRQETELRV
jgi:hypothetical protein